MKWLLIIISVLFCKNIMAQLPRVLYFVDVNDENEKQSVAIPFVIFDKNKYKEPASFMYQKYNKAQKQKAKNSLAKASLYTQKGTRIYLLKNNTITDSSKSLSSKAFGLSDMIVPSAVIKNANKYNIASNFLFNNNGITKIASTPKLKDITAPEEKVLHRNVLAQLDINQDGVTEYIYECNVYEGTYFEIYSFINTTWKLVYKGGYFGL
jgi:hypothetical protein